MPPLFAALLLIAAAIVCHGLPSSLSPDGARPSPKGVVDLSLPPRLRWRRVIDDVVARHTYEYSFGPLMTLVEEIIASNANATRLARYMEQWTRHRFPTYYEECQGVMDALNDHGANQSSIHAVIVWQFLTEIGHIHFSGGNTPPPHAFTRAQACTSLVTRSESGQILHARNDDGSGKHMMRNLTVDIDFVDQYGTGSVIAKATTFVGQVGAYTLMLPNVASLTQDERVLNSWTVDAYIDLVESHPLLGPVCFVMRQALIDSGNGAAMPPPYPRTFATIETYLANAPIGVEGYFVLAGTNSTDGNQGAIIARDVTNMGDNVTRTLRLGEDTTWVPFTWALIETNYDFWASLPYPADDPRRNVLSAYFAAQGQSQMATVDGLLQALSLQSNVTGANGVLNLGTEFSVIMDPFNATLQSYLRASTGCCS